MFKKEYSRRSANPIFLIFRTILSLIMFVLLLGGIYLAYKHFSGLDPLKLDPQALLKQVVGTKTPQQFLTVLSSFKLTQDKKVLGRSGSNNQSALENLTKERITFRFLLLADSHSDNNNLSKAIVQAKEKYPDLSFIIGLGDYTDVGTIDELKKAKNEFDLSNLRYFLIPGDHDLWDARDKGKDSAANFQQIFGPTFQSFNFPSKGGSTSGGNNFKFLLLDNSDNYKGMSETEQSWINSELDKAKTEPNLGILVFIHEPLYHPSSDHFMGRVDNNLKNQAQSLIYQLKTAGVKKIFAGDIHYFSEYEEPVTKLPMVTVGAVVTERNPQAPRFAVVSVLEDGSTKVEDVEIK